MDSIYVVTDIVILKIVSGKLCVLVVKRDTLPYKGKRCLPGGFMKNTETVEQTAKRIVKKETGILHIHLEQLHVFSTLHRDPRRRAIGIGFVGILTIDQEIMPGKNQQEVIFVDIRTLPKLVFNHSDMVKFAYQEIVKGIEDGSFIKYFLPKYFSLSDLQSIYEIILHRRYDKRNFRRMIDKNNSLRLTSYIEKNVSHRPAQLYTFIE